MKKINIKIPPFFKPSRNPHCLIKKNLLVPQTSIAGRFISLICDLCHRVWDSRSRTQMPGLMRDQIKFLREKGLREQWPRLAGRTTPGMTHMSCALWENMTWPHMRTTCNTMTSHILIVSFIKCCFDCPVEWNIEEHFFIPINDSAPSFLVVVRWSETPRAPCQSRHQSHQSRSKQSDNSEDLENSDTRYNVRLNSFTPVRDTRYRQWPQK